MDDERREWERQARETEEFVENAGGWVGILITAGVMLFWLLVAIGI